MLSANQITGFLNQLYLYNKIMKKPDFLHVDSDSWKLEVDWKRFGVGMLKIGCDQSVLWTQKLALCQRGMNELNWFLVCWYKFRKAKSYCNNFLLVVVKNGLCSFRSWNSKICCITRTNWWSELFFYMLIQI